MGRLQQVLEKRRARGQKILVAYLTGGLQVSIGGKKYSTLDYASELIENKVDAIEIGIPFSDPVMDGPVIQQASQMALELGATPRSVMDEIIQINRQTGWLDNRDNSISTIVMTYFNIVHSYGIELFAKQLSEIGVAGSVVPDLPLSEAGEWSQQSEAVGVDNILLAAPTCGDEQLSRICNATRGFVYVVGIMGVTGVRSQAVRSGVELAERIQSQSDRVTLVGVGVSNEEQAKLQCTRADGIIMGSAIISKILNGSTPQEIGKFINSIRRAIDNT